jgi:hypothetical protein
MKYLFLFFFSINFLFSEDANTRIELLQKEIELLKEKKNLENNLFKPEPNKNNYKVGIDLVAMFYDRDIEAEIKITKNIGLSFLLVNYSSSMYSFDESSFNGWGLGVAPKYFFNDFSKDSAFFRPYVKIGFLDIEKVFYSDYIDFETESWIYEETTQESNMKLYEFGFTFGYQWIWKTSYIQAAFGFYTTKIEVDNKNIEKENIELAPNNIILDVIVGFSF